MKGAIALTHAQWDMILSADLQSIISYVELILFMIMITHSLVEWLEHPFLESRVFSCTECDTAFTTRNPICSLIGAIQRPTFFLSLLPVFFSTVKLFCLIFELFLSFHSTLFGFLVIDIKLL